MPNRVDLLKPTAVNAILSDIHQLQAAGKTAISLMRGEPDFSTPPHIVLAAAKALQNGRTRYPDNRGEDGFRYAVSVKLKRDNELTYDARSEILVTTGATLGIYAALMAVIEDGDEVLLPDPVYDAYRSPVLLAGGRLKPVAATIHEGRFTMTAAAVEAAVTSRSRVLLLNTPWNPVGTVFRESELRAIGEVVLRHNLILISDEIYEALTYDQARHRSPAALSDDLRARTIVVNSLSKTYAMTGWRVGYCAAPSPFIEKMFLVLQQSSRGPATFVQDAAAEALLGPQQCVEEMRHEYMRRRQQVIEGLAGIPGVHVLPPEGGFFAMVDIRERGVPSDTVRRTLLNEAGVAVVHGAAYGAGGEGTLRVSFGSGGETLARGLTALRRGLESL